MEKYREIQGKKSNLERFTLVMYSIYHLGVLVASIFRDWEAWSSATVVAALVLSWMICLLKVKNEHFRARFFVTMIMISELVYAVHTSNLMMIFAPFLSALIITGLYGYADIFIIPFLTFILMVLYHVFIAKSYEASGTLDVLSNVLSVASVILAIFIIRFWVSKRNVTYQELMKVINELRTAERSKDDFLAIVSHEIRTPINTISGMSQILLQEEEPLKLREDIQAIQIAGRNLMRVVSDILDFSEIQSSEFEIVEEEYDITSSINDIINMCNVMKANKNLELIVDVDSEIPRSLLGDEKKIRRVIMNLVSNAVKFTNEGGVGIAIGFRREYYGINLNITISDSGIGMDEKSVEKLFTTYNQVDTSCRRQNGGVGLGLAISQALVRRMGGVINVKSRLGKGTTIKVSIPQKVTDERPIAQFDCSKDVRVISYVNMEQFEKRGVRDAYTAMMEHMFTRLGIYERVSRNLMELKRRMEREDFSHIFIGLDEYEEDRDYFGTLAKRTKVIVVLDRGDEKRLRSDDLLYLYKPFYILPVISVLNGTTDAEKMSSTNNRKNFIAPGAHVLVVDDNLMNTKVMEGLLAKYQIRVTRALSGKEALEKITEKCYDFVFMDHMMPEMDGVETLHRIRNISGKYYETVPIVALTANAIAGARKMLMAEGFSDFLEKPVESSVLERLLLRVLPENKIKIVEKPEQETEFHASRQDSTDESTNESTGSATAEEPEMVTDGTENFAIGDLDVDQGMMYCGGKDLYINILKEYAAKGEENWKPINALFEQQDWRNYVISVHAVKSSMLTIGAIPLSEMARALEQAGKVNNIEYIFNHHEEMIEEYQRVVGEIMESPYVADCKKENAGERNLPDLSDEEFEAHAIALEDAMYELDGSKMLQIIDELQQYAYHGTALKVPLDPVRHKVEMSDLMSAVSVVLQLKDRLREKSQGGNAE